MGAIVMNITGVVSSILECVARKISIDRKTENAHIAVSLSLEFTVYKPYVCNLWISAHHL